MGAGKKLMGPALDFWDRCKDAWGSELSTTYKRDKQADDEYLPKIKADRGAVKKHAIEDPMTRSAIDYKVEQAVGPSLRIKPKIIWRQVPGWSAEDARDVRNQMKDFWTMYVESDRRWIDATGLHTGSDLCAQHARIFEAEGNAMAAVFEHGENHRGPLSFAIGNIDPGRVRNPVNLSEFDDLRIHDGILKSRRGMPMGAFVHDHHLNSRRAMLSGDQDRYQFIPYRNRETGREQFIHSYVQITSDLSKGISKLAACLTLECQKKEYINALIEDAIAKAGLTFVITSNMQSLGDLMELLSENGTRTDLVEEYMDRSARHHSQLGMQHRGNKIARLYESEQLQSHSAQQAGGSTVNDLFDIFDVIGASCHDMSLEEYRQRWDRTNYSGARSGKEHLYIMVKALRKAAPWKLARKMHCLLQEDMVLQGRLKMPGIESPFEAWQFFMEHREAITPVELFGPPKSEIDKAKQAAGYIAEGTLGVGTQERYLNEVHGVDWEDNQDQICEEELRIWTKLQLMADNGIGAMPDCTPQEMILYRMHGGNAFLDKKEVITSMFERAAGDNPDVEDGENNE